MYRYIGRNGIITSKVFLDGIKYIPMITLEADKDKILTNGNVKTKWITIELDEVNNWKEIADENN